MTTTAEKQTYNGWTNRETWLVGTWGFFEDEEIIEALKAAILEHPTIVEGSLTLYLADWLKQSHDDALKKRLSQISVDTVLDLYIMAHLEGSIERINWLEIAEHYDDEIKEAISESH